MGDNRIDIYRDGEPVLSLLCMEGLNTFLMYKTKDDLEWFRSLRSNYTLNVEGLNSDTVTKQDLIKEYLGVDYLPRPWSLIRFNDSVDELLRNL